MAPVPKTKTITHFSHPDHQLTEINAQTKFLCHGCKTLGISKRYQCQYCNYVLHDYCATCPPTLSTLMHPVPNHPLKLVTRKPKHLCQNDRICDLCSSQIEGLFYHCKVCQFDLHPLCTQLPQNLRHALHPQHFLTLQPLLSASAPAHAFCAVCQGACARWRYRCETCNFDIHIDCVVAPPPPPSPPPMMNGSYGAYPGPSSFAYNPSQDVVGREGGGGVFGARKNFGRIMYALVEKLTVGAVADMVFGFGGSSDWDLSSFI
ncbi:DC1 [Dillenia turbinata]|uniref:DC1 n=1 Tax=Dillenia turbinata TaxID=194707 RepID=A0AAN8ZS59_9MAGN